MRVTDDTSPRREMIAPVDWPWALGMPPALCSERTPWKGALLRSWQGTSSVMEQPPLDQHYVVMHLGGAKRINRMRDGPALSAIAETGWLTLVPAGTAYVWRTEGPIAFAHLYLRPAQLDAAVAQAFDREVEQAALVDRVGCRDELLEMIFRRMLGELGHAADPPKLLLDSLLESFCIHLARCHVSLPSGSRLRASELLALHRLRRVLEFIEANLGGDVGLADLVEAAGTSQYHFSRAFHLATGFSPYHYLVIRRIELAKVLLMTGEESLAAVSARCGYDSQRQFAVMFKRTVGVGPKRFRLERKPR